MGDELPNPLNDATLINSLEGPGANTDNTDLTEVGQIVNDCTALVASLEDTIQNDIGNCLNECHGDTSLCQSCVLGDIASYVNQAGFAMSACQEKVTAQVNQSVGEAWAAAFGMGVPPPTQSQLEQAANGQIIDFAGSGNGGNGSGSGGDTLPTPTPAPSPTPIPIAPPPVAQCPTGINPAALGYLTVIPGAGYCLPAQWDTSAIHNWCVIAFGGTADAHIDLLPTSSTPGVYTYNGCHFAIPPTCPLEMSGQGTQPPAPAGGPTCGGESTGNGGTPTQPGGGGNPTLTGGGGTDTLPGGGGNGVPSQPITPPSGELECQAKYNVPDWLIAQCGSCTAAVADMLAQMPPGVNIQAVSWDFGQAYGFYADGSPLSSHFVPGCNPNPAPTGPGGNGGETTPPVQGDHLPNAFGVGYCDPSNARQTINDVAGYVSSFTVSFDSIYETIANNIDFSGTSDSTLTDIIKKPLVYAVSSIVKGLFSIAPQILKATTAQNSFGTSCTSDGFGALASTNALANMFGGWFGLIPQQTLVSNQYTLNLACQYLLPSAQDANAYYARGYVDIDKWTMLVRANGYCEEWQRTDVEARRTRLGVQDAYRLFQLGVIDESTFEQAWKRQGIDTDNELRQWVAAVKQYPGMADLIRMMVRDVEDQDVVDFLKLDGVGADAFENKWKDTLKQWGEAQGVPEVVARYYWRAHWQNPSPGSIYEWLHRFRPDDRDENDPNSKLVFTPDDARKALAIADYVPGLLDLYLGASYRQYRLVDIRRMWQNGTFDNEDQLRRAYRDLGFDDSHARNIAKSTVLDGGRARAKLLGELSVAEVQSAYRKDLLTNSEARDYLERAGLQPAAIPVTIDSIDARKTFDSRAIALKSLQQRYNRGEFTNAQATQALTDAYLDPADAQQIVSNWSFQRNAKEKSPTISMLCKWYGKGMITLDQMLIRVRNLNYNEIDALRIVESCNSDVQAKRQAEIETALKKAQTEQQKANREAAKLLREAKQAARELKLRHVTKRQSKYTSKNGDMTHTTTTTVVDKPDVNISESTEVTDVEHPSQDVPPFSSQ